MTTRIKPSKTSKPSRASKGLKKIFDFSKPHTLINKTLPSLLTDPNKSPKQLMLAQNNSQSVNYIQKKPIYVNHTNLNRSN